MHLVVIALTLSAAALHAVWNAFLGRSTDRLWTVTVMSFAMTVATIPAAFIVPPPLQSCWPYIAVSSFLQVGYAILLASAYGHGEYGQVYPIIRGGVPLLVTLAGFLFAGQRPGHLGLLGIVLVSTGIAILSLGKARVGIKALLLALATAMFVAGYVTADGIGIRRAGDAGSYIVWIVLAYGALMPLTFLALRRRLTVNLRDQETIKALAGGLASLASYGAILAALSLGELGPVSALRETSVVFSVLVGRMILHEILTRRRIFSCVIVAIGAACLGYAA